MRILPNPDHSPAWRIKILHHRVIQELVIDPPDPQLKSTPLGDDRHALQSPNP